MKLDLSDAEIEELIRTSVALVAMHGLLAGGTCQDPEPLVARSFLMADLFLDAVAKNDPAKKETT
jgi:hypothetical protein